MRMLVIGGSTTSGSEVVKQHLSLGDKIAVYDVGDENSHIESDNYFRIYDKQYNVKTLNYMIDIFKPELILNFKPDLNGKLPNGLNIENYEI